MSFPVLTITDITFFLSIIFLMVVLANLYRLPYVGEKARVFASNHGIPDLRIALFSTVVGLGNALAFLGLGLSICIPDVLHHGFSKKDFLVLGIMSLYSAASVALWKFTYRAKPRRWRGSKNS